MKDRAVPDDPNVTFRIEIHILSRDSLSLEDWVNAIHNQPDFSLLEAFYNAACDRWAGDDAALWTVREATFYRKEGLKRNAPGVSDCFTPSADLVRAAPLLYAAACEFIEVAATGKNDPQEVCHAKLDSIFNRLVDATAMARGERQPTQSQQWQGKSGYDVRNEREAWSAIQNGRPERDVLVKLARAARAADAQIMPDGTIAYAGNTLPDLDWNDRD
jgi:hypothetical protein